MWPERKEVRTMIISAQDARKRFEEETAEVTAAIVAKQLEELELAFNQRVEQCLQENIKALRDNPNHILDTNFPFVPPLFDDRRAHRRAIEAFKDHLTKAGWYFDFLNGPENYDFKICVLVKK